MDEKKRTVRAVERALDILLCFTQKSQLGMMEIAQLTKLNKSTVFRLLLTLEERGFVERDVHSDKYTLGIRVWELSNGLDQSNDPATLFLGEMEKLRDHLEETVSLYIVDGFERIRVQAVEGKQTIRRVAPIGARMPLTVGASSKVIMAFSEKDFQEEVIALNNMERDAHFLSQLKKVKKEGFALSIEERETGTAAISVPIFNRQDTFIAALAVSGPVSRMSKKRMSGFVPQVQEAAEKMGRKLKK